MPPCVPNAAGPPTSLIGLATALAIVAVTLPLFLNPVWVAFEQGRAQATAWTGFTEPELRAATDAILADLVVGPPEFDVTVAGDAGPQRARTRAHAGRPRGVHRLLRASRLVLAALALFIVVAPARRPSGPRAGWPCSAGRWA